MGYWNDMEKGAKTMANETGGDPQALYGRWAGSQIESAIGNKIMEPDDRAKQRYKLAAAAGLVMPGLKDGELMTPLGFAKGGIVPKGKKCMADGGMVDQAIAQRARFEGKGGPREDQIPVKVAGQNINVSDGEEAMIIPAKTANNPAAMKAIMDIISQTNDGRPVGGEVQEGGMYADGSRLRDYVQEPSPRPYSGATPIEQRLASVAKEPVPITDIAKLRSIPGDVVPPARVAPAASPATSPVAVGGRMNAVRSAINGSNATTLEDIASGVKNVATKAGAKVAHVGVNNVGKLAGMARASAPAAGIEGAVRGLNTGTDEYYTRLNIDPQATVVPQAVKDTAVRSIGVLSDVGASAINAVAMPVNLARHGLDTEKWYDYRNNFNDVQAANAKPAQTPVQGIAAVRDTTAFPVTPKAAPVAVAPAAVPSIAQGVQPKPVARKPSPAQAQRQRFVGSPQPVQPVANPVDEALAPGGFQMVAYGTNETQSTGAPRNIGTVYQNERQTTFSEQTPDIRRFTRQSAQADRSEVAQPVELVTAKGRAVFDPQNHNRLVPMDVYNTGRTQEYFDAQAQAAIDAQQNPDMAKIAGDIEQQKIAAGATLGAAGINAKASNYNADSQAETARREKYRGVVVNEYNEMGQVIGQRVEQVPIDRPMESSDRGNAGSQSTISSNPEAIRIRNAYRQGKMSKSEANAALAKLERTP